MSDARSVLVVGTGLIGTSIALALRQQHHRVFLQDVDAMRLTKAEMLDAGTQHKGEDIELAVVAIPPRAVPQVVIDLLHRLPDSTVCDTASVKGQILRELESHTPQSGRRGVLERYVGGHPIAGSARSGPDAARADLFQGRTWVIVPTPVSTVGSIEDARWLAEQCGATVLVMTAAEHDRALALTSHLPQLVASALADRFHQESNVLEDLIGPGFRDMTRLAGSDAEMWVQIATGNAEYLAAELDAFARTLAELAGALRTGPAGGEAVRRLLEDGASGRERVARSSAPVEAPAPRRKRDR